MESEELIEAATREFVEHFERAVRDYRLVNFTIFSWTKMHSVVMTPVQVDWVHSSVLL